jgi:3-hydroxyacyl-CoA dehydrogenase
MMTQQINKVAVIGSGVMGAGIAAHIANSGTRVLLLDIPAKEGKRNAIVEGAIEKITKADPAMVTHKRKLKLIEIGNLEDDIAKLKECDWIIEVVLEDLNIKQQTYKKIDANRKAGAIVSSNTSTIPLAKLTDGMSDDFKQHFLITHFFNPPRYMRLLELVTGTNTSPEVAAKIQNFCDVKLGKGVVKCNDTAGFIANRIGTFWIMRAMKETIDGGYNIEVADAVMSRPVGIPKTGVFGLMDLIGIDLLPLIAKSFQASLKADDEFNKIFALPAVVQKMMADGYTGRKGKGGFYRLDPNAAGGKKVKQVMDLKTGEYRNEEKPKLASVDAAKKDLRVLVEFPDEGGRYAWPVLRDTLLYTANLVGEIAEDIASIDEAMKLGYNWKFGPFELIDKLGTKWFADKVRGEGFAVPAIIEKAGEKPLYEIKDGKKNYLQTNGTYKAIEFNPEAWTLEEIKRTSKPVLKNPSAALWDVGDGIFCFEFTSKMNSLDPLILELINKSIEHVKANGKGLIIGNDSDNFTVGANIGVLLFAANVAAWKEIDEIIKQGQDAYMNLKYAPFPVVGAPAGMALGGGCEMLMHCDAVQAHVELYSGLVEVGVGLVPGWGGCKEFIYRQIQKQASADSVFAKMGGWFKFLSPIKTFSLISPLRAAFENIGMAKVSKSAEEAQGMLILNKNARITMNRKRLLADAKARCLELVPNYAAPQTYNINLPGKPFRTLVEMALKDLDRGGKITKYDWTVSRAVGQILSGGDTDITKEITEQQLLDLERVIFVELVKNKGSLDRLEHMLGTGKPLRN